MKRVGYAGLGTLLLLIAQGCTMPTEKPSRGDALVEATIYTLDGQRTSIFEMAKGKVAVFKFGASWCHWCTKQIPHLNEVVKAYPKDKVVVFDIDVQEDPKTAEAYAAKQGMAYPILLDPRGRAAMLYSVTGIPIVIIAGPDRKVLFRGNYTSFDGLNRYIAPAVKSLEAGGK